MINDLKITGLPVGLVLIFKRPRLNGELIANRIRPRMDTDEHGQEERTAHEGPSAFIRVHPWFHRIVGQGGGTMMAVPAAGAEPQSGRRPRAPAPRALSLRIPSTAEPRPVGEAGSARWQHGHRRQARRLHCH
jgi:hypothetical protein